MKRALEPESGPSLTPSKSAARCFRRPAKGIPKRPRVDNRCFFTPTIPHDETPATSGKTSAPVSTWPSSAQRQFETLAMHTPTDDMPSAAHANGTKPLSSQPLHIESLHEEDDGFILFSQSDYIRGSQAVLTPEPVLPHEEAQQQSTDTQAASTSVFNFHSQASELMEPGPATQPSQLHTQPSVTSMVQVGSLRPPAAATSQHMVDLDIIIFHDSSSQPTSTCFSEDQLSQPPALPTTDAHAVTPELGCTGVTSNAKHEEQLPPGPKTTPPLPRMFNIFLPRSVQRHLLIIRHGESEFNRACKEGKDFKDPLIFDPHLTPLGVSQARSLRAKLQQQLQLHGQAPLWVVSPLRRAIQTFLEACPLLERGEAGGSGTPQALLAKSQAKLNVELLPTISEFVVTAGDVGTPSSLLAQEFPQLATQLGTLPEQWWFRGPKKQNCALLKQFHNAEPKEHRQKRVSDLAKWLSTRSERFIILIGHCSFWHEFRGKTEKMMYNGEMRSMRW